MHKAEASGSIRNKTTALLAVALVSLFLSGCEHQNEGAITPAFAMLSSNGSAEAYAHLDHRNFSPNEINSNLIRIDKGDAYSIHIVSAFICNFHESGLLDITQSGSASNPCDNGSGDGGGSAGTRGEIAILANVVERTATIDTISGLKGAGRVVYYNTDVRESGQLLNVSPIPVHGPILYRGAPLHIELAILELDNEENEKTKQMIQSLAQLGQKAYPPSSLILNALTQVGTSLLSGDQDDTEFRYRFEFDQPRTIENDKDTNVMRRPLSEGYIAFMRSEDRSEDIELGVKGREWHICPAQGVIAAGSCSSNKVYRDRTWVLVRVSKEDKISATDLEVGEALAAFTTDIGKPYGLKFEDLGATLSNINTTPQR